MKNRFDVVVVGAGMVGLVTAALLAKSPSASKLRITVLDAGSAPEFDVGADIALRVSAVSQGSIRILRELKAWDTIRNLRACPYRHMRVWDARDVVEGPNALHFDAAEFALGELGFIVENSLIQHAVLQRLRQLEVEVRFETLIEKLCVGTTGDETEIRLQDGSLVAADLVVGADGVASLVREEAGISVQTWSYPQSAFVTHVRPEKEHQDTAWQRFLQDGPLAFLPLNDGRVSVVWSTTPEQAEHAVSASDADLADLLGDASDGLLGKIAIAGPRGSFPLKSQHAEHYVMQGVALVGDAAHAVHPLAGQGANLGMADAAALAMTVAEALENGEYPGDLPTLRRYERQRKGANKTMLHFIDAINRLFLADSGTVAALRGSGMRLFNQSGPIQRRAVEVALGIKV